jgi:MFS family permease
MQDPSGREPRFFYGYVVAAASFAVLAMGAGANYSFSVFFEPLQQSFGWSRAVTSGAMSAFIIGQGVFAMASGRLTDRFGPRMVVTVAGILFGAGLLMMSQATAIWQVYVAYGVLAAAGHSATFTPLSSTTARWFQARRGLMTGIVMAGTSLGTMVLPPFANWLIYRTDWRTSYMVLGLAMMIVVVIAAQFLRRDPSTMGLQPDGGARVLVTLEAPDAPPEGVAFRDALRTSQFWLLCLAFTGFGYTLQAVMSHVVIHSRGLGLSPASAASVMTVIGAFGFMGRVGIGGLADRFGAKRLVTAVLVMMSLSLFWLAVMPQPWAVYIFAVLFGLAYGGTVPQFSNRVAELFGLRAHGAVLGVIVFGVALGSALGPAFTGYGYDRLSSYEIPFVICGVVVALAALLSCLVKPLPAKTG